MDDNFAEHFHDVELVGEEIYKKEFEECRFSECDFSSSRIKASIFDRCYFKRCDFSLATLAESRFSEVTFDACRLIGIEWGLADWSSLTRRPLKFRHSTLQNSSFFGLSMPKWEITECNAHGVDFREADLHEADLRYTDFAKALFHHTNLTACNFVEAINFEIDISANIIKGAKFSRYEALRLLDSIGIVLSE